MQISVNGKSHDLKAATLAEALSELGYGAAVVATALNGHFVAAPARGATRLNDNDKVEIVSPMQGG